MKKRFFVIMFFLMIFSAQAFSMQSDFSMGFDMSYLGGDEQKAVCDDEFGMYNEFPGHSALMGIIFENYNMLFDWWNGTAGFMESFQIGNGFRLMGGIAYRGDFGYKSKFYLGAGLELINASLSSVVDGSVFMMGLASELRIKFTPNNKFSPVVHFHFGYDPVVSGEYRSDEGHKSSSINGTFFTFGFGAQFCINNIKEFLNF